MDINDFPEKTQEQLRNLMKWTETTSIVEVIDKVWQIVKLENFGDPKYNITIKASGPNNAKALIYHPCRNARQSLGHTTGICVALNENQQRAYEEVIKFADHGLMTPVREKLEAVFDQVIIEGPGY